MKPNLLHSTLREMHRLMRDARSWVALAALSLVVGLIGPFSTFEMPAVERFVYWTAIVLSTAVVGTLTTGLINRLLLARGVPRYGAALIAGGIAGAPICLCVVLVNLAAFGPEVQPIEVLQLTGYCSLIAAAVTLLSVVFSAREPALPAAAEAGPASPSLLERLPLPQRGRLLHIAVADHYVEVSTDRGKALLLMRLSDAIRESAPVAGLQVHRSHWVALDAVTHTKRQAGKPVLELETGIIVPISRSYLGAARKAGLVS